MGTFNRPHTDGQTNKETSVLLTLLLAKLYCHLLEHVDREFVYKHTKCVQLESKYSTCTGSFPALVGLLVDHASV